MANIKVKRQYKPYDQFSIPEAVFEKYPEKEFHFVWAWVQEKVLDKKEGEGYEYVLIEPSKIRKALKSPRSGNDSNSELGNTSMVRKGDSVLMCMPADLWKEKCAYKQEMINTRARSVINAQKAAIRNVDNRLSSESELKISKGV